MSGGWGPLLGELVPLALVVAVSPLSIIPALLLVLHTARPRPTGLAYMVGWLVGLVVVTAVFVAVPRAFGGTGVAPHWAAYVRIGIGVVLIAFAVWRWLTRHKAGQAPALLKTVGKIGPVRAAGLGVVLSFINPKFLVIDAAAGLAISAADLKPVESWLAVAIYAVLAASTVLIPMLAYAVAADRLDGTLERVREWIERQHAVITAAILLAIGIVLLYQGIRAA